MAREDRGAARGVIRDGDAIGALLTRLGAHDSVLAWEERRVRRGGGATGERPGQLGGGRTRRAARDAPSARPPANRRATSYAASMRRSARAAVAAGARVQRALEILGDDIP